MSSNFARENEYDGKSANFGSVLSHVKRMSLILTINWIFFFLYGDVEEEKRMKKKVKAYE